MIPASVGSIKLFTGPMFASKTTSMLGDIRKHIHAKKRCVIIKYEKDTRYDGLAKSGGIMNHDGVEFTACKIIIAATIADAVAKLDVAAHDVIGVDEVQFFPDAAEQLQLLANAGKIILCSGLSGNYEGRQFPVVAALSAVAERVVRCSAVCMKCYDEANFTKKIAGARDGRDEIGGADKYISVCRRCMWT